MEATFLSSVVRETLETSLNKHAQASQLLAMKTSSLGVWLRQIRSQLWNKQVISVLHALAKAWASKILKIHKTTACRSAGGVGMVWLWSYSSQAAWGAYCCCNATVKEYLSFTSVGSRTAIKSWRAKTVWWLLSQPHSAISPRKSGFFSSISTRYPQHRARSSCYSGLQGDDTHFLVAL